MSRPSDWSPLDLPGDPIPGDPDGVRTEARHYGTVAEAIQDQVDRLRRISSQDGLEGDYSEELRESCEDLADHLGKAKGRFETTSEQLFKLAPALEDAQDETKAALDDAIAADEEESGEGLMDSEGVRNAKNRLDAALSAWDDEANRIADEIRDGADDDMKDGMFEGIKAWVKEHAALLTKISEILGAIVVVLAIVIFIVSNPAGWLVGLAFLAGALLLTVDALLAASGEGSWADVALDVVGLATLGLGSIAGKLAKGARSLSMFKGTKMAGLRGFGESLRGVFNSAGVLGKLVTPFKPSTWSTAVRAGSSAADDVAGALGKLPVPNAFKSGQLADDLADISRIINPTNPAAIHSGAVGVSEAMSNAGNLATGLAAATHNWADLTGIGAGVDELTTYEIPTQTLVNSPTLRWDPDPATWIVGPTDDRPYAVWRPEAVSLVTELFGVEDDQHDVQRYIEAILERIGTSTNDEAWVRYRMVHWPVLEEIPFVVAYGLVERHPDLEDYLLARGQGVVEEPVVVASEGLHGSTARRAVSYSQDDRGLMIILRVLVDFGDDEVVVLLDAATRDPKVLAAVVDDVDRLAAGLWLQRDE